MKDHEVDPSSILEKRVSFAEALRFWIKLGFISFGGPTGQIAIMHTELVERKKWIDESHFLHALNYCMLLPGPEAQQLAIYIGWLLHGTLGGILAGAFFVIPSILVLWCLSYVYAVYGNVFWIASIFYGLKAAILAIVAAAMIRIAKKALRSPAMWCLAALSFVAIFFLHIPFPYLILAAGMIGLLGTKLRSSDFSRGNGAQEATEVATTNATKVATTNVITKKPSLMRALKIIVICMALWWIPVFLIGAKFGWSHSAFQEGLFFSKAAMVTFGGAYAVLPYVAQQAVEHFHWLKTGEMMDGLALAETTPGPLIMVVQFAGFMGGWNQPGALSPILSATLGALITTWVTFVPCFLWIFLGAPYVELLRDNRNLNSALSAITAAVVGVILNLAVWFGIHAIFPGHARVDWFLLVTSIVAFYGIIRWKWNMIYVIFAAGLLGLLFKMLPLG